MNGVALSAVDAEISELIRAEYVFYKEEVKPMTDLVDLTFDRLEPGMLDEIRKFVGHITDAATDTAASIETRKGNICDAHTHLRRILLDCYKVLCIAGRDVIKDFDRKYRWSDLSNARDGEFVAEYLA